MRAAVGAGGQVAVRDVDLPDGDGELVAVHAVSICASDLRYLKRGSAQVLGHEIAGVLADGTRVVAEASFGCGACVWCGAGERNLCHVAATDIVGMTTPGGMAEYFRAPRRVLCTIPDALSLDDATLVEPGSVAWHACRKAGIAPGMRVAVVGAGAIGILAVAAAQDLGAVEVALASRHDYQAQMGLRFGAAAPSGVYDAVIEASGTASGLAAAIELTRPKGVVATVTVYEPDVEWPYRAAFFKEVAVIPSIGYSSDEGVRDFTHVANLLAKRPELAAHLITDRVPLEEARRAFDIASTRPPGTYKVVVHTEPWGEGR